MPGRTAVLAIRIVADAAQARRELDATGSRMSKLTKPAIAVAGGVAALFGTAVDAASNLQQATGGAQSVFGKYANDVVAQSKKAADGLGLSQAAFLQQSTILGSQLKNLGTPMDQVAGSTQTLIEKGADLAAMFGGTTADAVDAISSLMRGERDPIERYGVSINQAAIDAYEAAHGLGKLTGAAKKNADAQATLAILNKQTASATGQFARETNTAAGASEIANAKFDNAQAALGQRLLPIVAKAKSIFADMASWVAKNSGTVFAFTAVIGGLAAAVLIVNTATKAWASVTKAYAAVQKALNLVMEASPLQRWIALIALVVAAVIYAWQHFQTFRDIVKGVFATIMAVVQPVVRFFTQTIPRALQSVLGGARDFVGSVVGAILSIPGRIASLAGSMLSAGADFILAFFRGIGNFAAKAGSFALTMAKAIVNGIVNGLNALLDLPWKIGFHIGMPWGVPDIDFGPYTVVPRIPLWASAADAAPGPDDVPGLMPGWTMMAATRQNAASFTTGTAPAAKINRPPTVKVYFQGLVTDPEAVARQIRQVVGGSDARNGLTRVPA